MFESHGGQSVYLFKGREYDGRHYTLAVRIYYFLLVKIEYSRHSIVTQMFKTFNLQLFQH